MNPSSRIHARSVFLGWAASSKHRFYNRLRLNFSLYPGILNYRAADFLTLYYEQKKASAGWMARALRLVVYVAFQAWLPFRARAVAKKWGEGASWRKRALAICRDRFVDPNDIALFRIQDADELDYYMRRFEHIGVGRAIAFPDTDHSLFLTDKRRFYECCAAGEVPHPRIFAILADGRAEIRSLPADGQQLFVKPACGTGGKGAHVRTFTSSGGDGGDAFRRFLLADPECLSGDWIIQPRMETHPDIRDISVRALPTARITTILNERNEPEIVTTVLRLAASDQQVVDNIGVGGVSVPVDPATGLLGTACGGMRPGEYSRHPLTGAQIEGRRVPEWPMMKRLALETHSRHFRDHVMIGWDVAVSAPGPCLLEANPRPSIIMAQRACRMPVGKTRMGDLITYHLQQRLKEGKGRPRFLD